MLDVGSLQRAAQQQHTNADSKRHLAEQSLAKAEQYEKSGDTSHAETERKMAEKFFEEADQLDSQGGAYELNAMRRQHQINNIEKEIERLNSEHQKKIYQLEREKSNLSGHIF